MKSVVLLLSLWLALPPQEEQIERTFHAGQQDIQQGNFARAAEEFKKVLALDPKLVEAQVNLGLAYQSLFEYDLAIRYLSKGLHERPNLLGPTVIVGMDYLKLGSPEKAIPYLQQALKLDPSNHDASDALASAYLAQENFRAAADQYKKLASLATDKSEALYKLGHQYLDLAAQLAYRGAHRYRDSAWGHRFLGDLLFQRSRWEDALKEYQKALSADPQQSGLHTSLGETLRHLQKPEEAEKEFRQESQSDSQNETEQLKLGKLNFKQQRYDAAAESLAQVQGISKENVEASYWLARTYLALGSEAYAHLQESFPNSWRACQLRAEGFSLSGNFDDAVKEFHTALQIRPNEPELHEALAELYLDHHSDDAAAQAELEQSLSLDPASTRALYLLGRLYVVNKENEKALPYLQKAVRLKPDFIEANSLLGTAYVRLGQYAEAVPKLQKAAPSDHYGSVHYQLSLAYRKLGKPELARKELALSQDLRRSYLERDEAIIMGTPQPEPDPQ